MWQATLDCLSGSQNNLQKIRLGRLGKGKDGLDFREQRGLPAVFLRTDSGTVISRMLLFVRDQYVFLCLSHLEAADITSSSKYLWE